MGSNISDLAKQLGFLLKKSDLKITTAESCTGGGIASAITSVAGSSGWFEYGFVTYANSAKEQLLHVSKDTLMDCGAVSQEVVEAMAVGALKVSGAEIAVAVSGVAGPDGGAEDKPVGTVWLCWQRANHQPVSHKYQFDGDRSAIRQSAVEAALEGLIEILHN